MVYFRVQQGIWPSRQTLRFSEVFFSLFLGEGGGHSPYEKHLAVSFKCRVAQLEVYPLLGANVA